MGSPEQDRDRQSAAKGERDRSPHQITLQDRPERDPGHHERRERPVAPVTAGRGLHGGLGPQPESLLDLWEWVAVDGDNAVVAHAEPHDVALLLVWELHRVEAIRTVRGW